LFLLRRNDIIRVPLRSGFPSESVLALQIETKAIYQVGGR